jgi:cupin fold WbuC family metalloprotein
LKLEFPEKSLRPIDTGRLAQARELAAASPRRRAILRYHEHGESIQRMLNAIEPDSYVCPHRHQDPDKVELFVALAGSAVLCRFDDEGTLREQIEFGAGSPVAGVEVPARTWHSLVSLEPGTVLLEVIEGPFDPRSHKEFAAWAPAESDPAGSDYLRELRRRLGLDA